MESNKYQNMDEESLREKHRSNLNEGFHKKYSNLASYHIK